MLVCKDENDTYSNVEGILFLWFIPQYMRVQVFKIKAIQKENRAGVLRFQLYTTDQLRIQVLLLVSG